MDWVELPGTALLSIFYDDCDSEPLPNALFRIIRYAYAPIGGYEDFKTHSDLPGNHTKWLVLDAKQPRAVVFGKSTSFGVKWCGLGSDKARPDSKFALMDKVAELMFEPGNYAELGGRLAEFIVTRGLPTIRKEKTVREVISKPLEWHRMGWYNRYCHGEVRTKILCGTPNL